MYLSAMQRHIDGHASGERCAPVDGTHDLGNVMACSAILIEAEAAGMLNNDRPPSAAMRVAYADVEAEMAKLKGLYAAKA